MPVAPCASPCRNTCVAIRSSRCCACCSISHSSVRASSVPVTSPPGGRSCSWSCRRPSPSRDCSSSDTTPATAATPSTTGSTRSSDASHSCRRSRRSRSGTWATTLPTTVSPTSRAATRSGCPCRPRSGRARRRCAAVSSASIARVSARASTTPSKCGGRSSSCPARSTSAFVAPFSSGTTCWC